VWSIFVETHGNHFCLCSAVQCNVIRFVMVALCLQQMNIKASDI